MNQKWQWLGIPPSKIALILSIPCPGVSYISSNQLGWFRETSFWTYILHLGHWPSFVVVVKMTQKHVI